MEGYIRQIRERTEAKELRLAGCQVMTYSQWILRGGVYRGTIGEAAKAGYHTIRACENMGRPVTEEERETLSALLDRLSARAKEYFRGREEDE